MKKNAMTRVVRWSPVGSEGFEHLVLRGDERGITAEAIVAGEESGTAFGLHYRLVCDAGWRVREVRLDIVGGAALALRSDGGGRWQDGDGRPIPGLDGCIDVDIAATPFTNTLPIRRLDLAVGEERVIRVAYMTMPELGVAAAEQRYRRVERHRYRYESLGSGFRCEFDIDQDGLVLDYPGLFRRIR